MDGNSWCSRPALLALTAISLCTVVRASPAEPTASQETSRPNIVLIIADDMSWNDVGAYGHPHIRTPFIDQLAADGMRFDHAYVTASSCSPSRASIITGKYPHNTGAEQLHWPLPAEVPTFVEKLRQSGYHTAAAGKWHLGAAARQHFGRRIRSIHRGIPATQRWQRPTRQDDCQGSQRLREMAESAAIPSQRSSLLSLVGVTRSASRVRAEHAPISSPPRGRVGAQLPAGHSRRARGPATVL